MRKLLVLIICLLCGGTVSLNAQIARLQDRDAEWKSYSLPQTNFARQVTPEKTVVFRVPADWKQEGTELVFIGPHDARLTVTAEKVPHGYPLTEYVAGVLKATADALGSSEGIFTRRTQFQDLEARELYLESPDAAGKMFRSTTWITIYGPLVLRVSLIVPVEHGATFEPFLKATVQSVMFVPAHSIEFETVRAAAIKTPAAGPINEIENIVGELNQLNSDREAAIKRLTPLFVSQPETAVDLLLDRRTAVRSAAVEALARSRNAALKSFLWHILYDPDPFVAEAAARRLGPETDVISQLLAGVPATTKPKIVGRLWPFMSKKSRLEFMQGVFSQTAGDPRVHMRALMLLGTMQPDEFKFPIERIMAAKHDPLTIVALQVANNRGDALPVDTLIKLAASPNEKIRRLAVESLGQSGVVTDIPRLQSLLSKTPAAGAPANDKEATTRKALDEEIKLSIKKINLRSELTLAKREQWREIISNAASDPSLREFAWRFDCELTTPGCSPPATTRALPAEFKIKSFAENLFPKRISHYTAIPNPGQSVQRFYETLHGLQLDSPRAQANLILVMGGIRQKLGQQLGAPPDAPALIDYTGIKSDAPIVMGAWTAAGAHDSISAARRRAIVLRVKDRERFERLVENYQDSTGAFVFLADYLAVGTRAAAALPALIPFSAQAMLAAKPDKPKAVPVFSYSLVGQTEWNGIPIKTIEHRSIDSESNVHNSSTYLTFVRDVVILTQDLATLRDLLSNTTAAEQQLLAGNEEFRRAVGTDGDVVYFSDLKVVFATPTNTSGDSKSNESGALKFSSSSWENSHRLVFDESEWSKPLLPFQPKELSAPRDLLPSSTLAYYLMNVDLAAAWQTWPKTMNLRENRFEVDPSFWSLDFQREVLPELGPECGAVLLELPDFYAKEFDGGTWAAFCKLKTNKLADAFAAGKLFRNIGPTTGVAEIKREEACYFVAIKNGFIVVSNKSQGLSALGGKTNLAASRDFARAAEKAPAGIVAFGGYNLEAAIAAGSAKAGDGLRAQMAGMIFSVASAFHSQSFFATASPGAIEGRSSVAMDREGRYAVADFSYLPRAANITYATLEPHGVPIIGQNRLSNLVLKVRAKAPGPIDSIRDDIKSTTQKVEQKSPNELIVTVAARRISDDKKIQLPISNPEVAAFLKSTGEITSNNQNVIEQARQIAGDDRDAWSVARKLAEWTNKNLQWKSVARAGAPETLATREADCSEFSQLYVSMARSLGLPARIVSGLVYSGNSFGGHAWVEVWIGEWAELDPTWGTDFVDATHIRNEASTLVTAAALNLIDLEVLETRRTVAEFQKSPRALAEHLAKTIALADRTEVEATLDLAILTDEFMGQGAWTRLNEHERDLVSSAYRRTLSEIVEGYGYDGEWPGNIHVLHLEEKGDRAEATCYDSMEDDLLKLGLLRRDDVWYLVEMVQSDTGLHLARDTFEPAIKSIEATRSGKKPVTGAVSDFMKVMNLIDGDPDKALEAADLVLQTKPGNQIFRYLKVLALLHAEKEDEATKLLTELADEQPPYAPAVFKLAENSSEQKSEEAIRLYQRYSALEPYDLRAYRQLAELYESSKQTALAEAAYRKAIAVDPFEVPGYINLSTFLIRNNRLAEVAAVFQASDKYLTEGDDVLASVLSDLEDDIKIEDAERLAASEAHRLKTSVWANLALSDIYIREQRYSTAVEIIARAARIDPKMPNPHIAMSSAYLKQSRLNEALKAVDHALTLDENNSSAHYRRATVLARLGRKKDAMTALQKSIELDPATARWIGEDDDLKPLRTLPAFKKLVSDYEKRTQELSPR